MEKKNIKKETIALLLAYSLGLIWLAESTVDWFFVREKHCWLAG
jgi:hypothetical protein